ncbi:MAG: hypothetical protein JO307_18525 [Bryobacterales bacterium]|nr:hypothetical protein [Bryobacterales bacterium]MBV9398186.1 hypothetical protein [Bryobacterales bacterium]
MRHRYLSSIASVLAVAGVFALAAERAVAQTAKVAAATAKSWTQPKTPWGDPDLQGTWTSDDCIGTPLSRPVNLGDRLYYTEDELADREKQLERQQQNDLQETVAPDHGVGTGPPGHWGERARRPCRQTSLVVDPPDGRVPNTTADARLRPVPEGAGNNAPKADSWEDFSYYIRCITRGVPGSIFPVIYGNGQQIVQGHGYVTIMQEMVHEARVIPLDGRPHASTRVRSYMGDPRGHWEGDTLVVETTNFLGNRTGIVGNGGGMPTSESMTTIERFTRVGPNEMRYEITIDDPKTWVKPFKVGFPLTQEPGYRNFEYACHEGNYAMFDSLSGARALEKKAAAAKAAGK